MKLLFLMVIAFGVRAAPIAQWTFTNSYQPNYGQGSLSLIGGVVSAGFSLAAPQSGNILITSNYPPQSTANKTAGIECNVSTRNYAGIHIFWRQRTSETASLYTQFQITTNGTDYFDYSVIGVPFSYYSEPVYFHLGSVPGTDNNPNFGFRIVAEFGSTVTGTNTDAYLTSYAPWAYTPDGTIEFSSVGVYADSDWIPIIGPIHLYSQGLLQFGVSGAYGSNYVVQAQNGFGAEWVPILTNTPPFIVRDTNVLQQRFYRAFMLR